MTRTDFFQGTHEVEASSGAYPWMAFDPDPSSAWRSGTVTSSQFISLKVPTHVLIYGLLMTPSALEEVPIDFEVQGVRNYGAVDTI
eukprot:scaffold171195_cov43-Tisochrysis_lutea.AAC.1